MQDDKQGTARCPGRATGRRGGAAHLETVTRAMASALAAGMLLAATGSAGTVVVPDDEPELVAALAQAVAGDTVFVRPGRYVGTFTIPNGVSMIAAAGPDSTVLDAAGGGRVILFAKESDTSTLLDGFTITGGKLTGKKDDGAGILCTKYASPRINNNIIRANAALGNDARGGGIACLEGAEAVISNNRIADNSAAWGGGIYVGKRTGWVPSPIISSNRIEGNEARRAGGGIAIAYTSEAMVSSNIIAHNTVLGDGEGGAGIYVSRAQPVIEENVIWQNADASGVASGICLVDYAAPVITRNIIAKNNGAPAVLCISQEIERSAFKCNDVWANEAGDFGPGCKVFPGNITADPRFCGADSGDFALRPSSPCLTAAGCGRIGVRGIGCQESAGADSLGTAASP